VNMAQKMGIHVYKCKKQDLLKPVQKWGERKIKESRRERWIHYDIFDTNFHKHHNVPPLSTIKKLVNMKKKKKKKKKSPVKEHMVATAIWV
jgi:hypothetical protein